MSDATSALQGARFDGLVRVEDAGLEGMVTIRGDLGSAALVKAVTEATGTDMPGQREVRANATCALAWMSPDELLLLCPYAEAQAVADRLAAALADEHALVVNVSDARAVFRLSGSAVREVLAKLAPVDMAPGRFEPGQIRRTRLAQVAAAFWMSGPNVVHVVSFRSVGRYVFDLLCAAADPDAGVNHF